MKNTRDKEIEQLTRINETILEGLEQLLLFQKEQKFKESIFVFGSIVEGFAVIERWIKKNNNDIDKKIVDLSNNIEKFILLIAKSLETNNTSKSFEILQFSLIPYCKQLKNEFKKEGDNKNNKDIISIGVYLCQDQPLNIIPEPRVKALSDEALSQGIKLFYFTSDDVNFGNETINAKIYDSSEIKTQVVKFPSVINNINPTTYLNRSNTEKKLRKKIPFTTFGIGDKFNLPAKFVEKKLFVELLVPFKIMTDLNITINFIEDQKKAVIKPIRGRQGQKIYFIQKKSINRYQISDHKKKIFLNYDELIGFIKALLSEKDKYMIQKFIQSKTKDTSPFDIRAHLQKNGEGKWIITKIYPRIGNKKSILSNISRGGKSAILNDFLLKEYGKIKGAKLEKELLELSLELAWNTDKLYGSAIDELGLDLALDENCRIWLHEINGGPQSTYHENERAKNTISYAKYIAENGLFLTNEFDNHKGLREFDVNQSNLEHFKSNNSITFGMLTGTERDTSGDALKLACSYVANFENVNYFYFYPQDVDIFNQKIKGYLYNGYKWDQYIFDYPDVVIDRFRMRGIEGYDNVYQELAHIPFTNQNNGGSMNKLDLYNLLEEKEKIAEYLIPYREVSSIQELESFILSFKKIILKPIAGSFGKGLFYIELIKNNYNVKNENNDKVYSKSEFTKYFREVLNKGQFVVQKFISSRTIDDKPFDIRVHAIKSHIDNPWEILAIIPRVGYNYHKIAMMSEGGYISEWQGFIKRNYAGLSVDEITAKLESVSLKIIKTFEKYHKVKTNEIALDLALTKDLEFYLIEANINKPAVTNFEFKYAKFLIELSKNILHN